MRRLRRAIWFIVTAVGAAGLAACGAGSAEPTLDATAIAASVQQSQTAAALATGVAPPPASETPAPATEEGETAAATSTVEPTATATDIASPTATAEATATEGAGPVAGPTSETPGQPGTITGALGYPSEVIPRLRVYAWDRDSGQWRYVITNQNDSTYALQVPPGKYIVFAYLHDGGEIAGGYTNAVLCGLDAACTDHSLYLVTVGSGQPVSGVNVTDWYGPPGSIPQPPG